MYMTISIIVSVGLALMSTNQYIKQNRIAQFNDELKGVIREFTNEINQEIAKGRLSLNKLLSLWNARNITALSSYVLNNPVISKTASEIQKDSETIAAIQSQQQALENEITTLQSELGQLGYAQSLKGTETEEKSYKQVKKQLEAKAKEYNDLASNAENTDTGTVRTFKPITSDIDARSQNINGGLNNNNEQIQ